MWFNLGPHLWSFMCVASGFVKEDKVRSNSKNIIVEIVHLSKVLTKTNENAGKKKKKRAVSGIS